MAFSTRLQFSVHKTAYYYKREEKVNSTLQRLLFMVVQFTEPISDDIDYDSDFSSSTNPLIHSLSLATFTFLIFTLKYGILSLLSTPFRTPWPRVSSMNFNVGNVIRFDAHPRAFHIKKPFPHSKTVRMKIIRHTNANEDQEGQEKGSEAGQKDGSRVRMWLQSL